MTELLLQNVLTPDNLKAANASFAEFLKKFNLEEGELGPILALTVGKDEPKVQVITLKTIRVADDSPEGFKELTVYGRCIESAGLMEAIKALMGNGPAAAAPVAPAPRMFAEHLPAAEMSAVKDPE